MPPYRHVLMWQASKKVTTLGATELMEKRHPLHHCIDSWCEIQQIYMPCIDQVCATHSATTSSSSNISSTPATTSNVTPSPAQNPRTTCLFLPLAIPSSFWTTGCIKGLVNKEQRLCLCSSEWQSEQASIPAPYICNSPWLQEKPNWQGQSEDEHAGACSSQLLP